MIWRQLRRQYTRNVQLFSDKINKPYYHQYIPSVVSVKGKYRALKSVYTTNTTCLNINNRGHKFDKELQKVQKSQITVVERYLGKNSNVLDAHSNM